ncbi:MAG: DASS family sodium-coupled anion symporter [Oscillospiraceae bacterium]|nr:DASS family sodium-coupled anion symporter [Oscillospiraceae bacterium]
MALLRNKIGFFLGIGLFIAILLIPAPEGLGVPAWRVVAITTMMAVFWITEALPMAGTALIPIVMFPVFGIMDSGSVTVSYGSNVIFLFMGGFFLAVTMEKWNLHRRIALKIIQLTGTSPPKMILGFAIATFLLSMWVSNTATAVMMVPIGIAVVKSLTGTAKDAAQVKKELNFGKSLMLMIAYTCTIGGVTTIIATPANAIAVGILYSSFGLTVTFFQWMMVGLPLGIVMLVLVYLLLTRVLFRTGDLELMGGKAIIEEEYEKLGPMTKQEKRVLIIGGLMVVSWISRGFINLDALDMITDTQIAIGGTLLLFTVPAKKGERILDWNTAWKIPWGIVLLFGGGIAIATAFERTGLAQWISENVANIEGLTLFTTVLIATAVVCSLTEIASNTAIATLFIPIMGASAIALGIHPFATVIAVCLASSMCFMMPVATPPNAIAFASGHMNIKDMITAGVILNFCTIALVVVTILFWLPLVWGVDLGITPQSVLDFIVGATG